MAMLTLNGTLHNCYEQSESKDRETGEIRPATLRAQILCENVTPTGEKRFEMVTLKVHNEGYRKLVGKHVRIPVGAFVSGSSIQYYALKNEHPAVPSPQAAA